MKWEIIVFTSNYHITAVQNFGKPYVMESKRILSKILDLRKRSRGGLVLENVRPCPIEVELSRN